MHVASFITPHGFGHAARQSAVLAALQKRLPDLEVTILTTVPEWFFHDSLPGTSFNYIELACDLGLVQNDPLQANFSASVQKLRSLYPLNHSAIDKLASQLSRRGVELIIADIAPMGIAVAEAAGLPSLLVENFTWDWIYEPLHDKDKAFGEIGDYLQSLFKQATWHIKCEPYCANDQADMVTAPVARPFHDNRNLIRDKLGVNTDETAVLMTFGGVEANYEYLNRLPGIDKVVFIIPGAGDKLERWDHLISLPRYSDIYHPDLVHACDAVVGKLGYSTFAEVNQAGLPWAYVSRDEFRETEPLVKYVDSHINAIHVSQQEYQTGKCAERIPELLTLSKYAPPSINGADQIAEFIVNHFPG